MDAQYIRELQELIMLEDLLLLLTKAHDAFDYFCVQNQVRVPVILDGEIDSAILPKWIDWVEKTCFPLNAQIAALIQSSLAVLSEIPDSFSEFLEYHYHWVSRHIKHKQNPGRFPYQWHSGRNFPQRIDLDVAERYIVLEGKLKILPSEARVFLQLRGDK